MVCSLWFVVLKFKNHVEIQTGYNQVLKMKEDFYT